MDFGERLWQPVLRTAVSVGEATIRQACGGAQGLRIHVDLGSLLDGREGLRVTLLAPGAIGGFVMVLRNYFDRGALERAARHAWMRRVPCGEAAGVGVFDPRNN